MPGYEGVAIEIETVARGYPSRYTDFMEKLQVGYITAVAAAVGCILAEPQIDDGVDIMARHESSRHTSLPDKTARLEIQLKATSAFVDDHGDHVSVQMRKDRWDYYRAQEVTIGKIVVSMSLPRLQENWTAAGHEYFAIRHCAYWVNPKNLPASSAKSPTVAASKLQIFDDVALCRIMERIGQGGAP